jgi:hypothetical protein
VGGPGDRHIGFTLTWDIAEEDYSSIEFPPEFLPPSRRTFEVTFHHSDSPSEQWLYRLDGQRLPIYSHLSPDTRWPVFKDEFELRNLIPRPNYVNVRRAAPSMFEMYPFNVAGEWRIHNTRPEDPARLLLAVGGLNAATRPIAGRGIEEPWPDLSATTRPEHSLEQIEYQLAQLSDRLTTEMQRWWHDPPGLRVRVRLAGSSASRERQQKFNSFLVVREILGPQGPSLSGDGILWFFGFLVELLYLQDQNRPMLLLFDEAGSPLHPSAQRAVAKLITVLSKRHQIIYSTHSPFLIDWNFPQRIRLFVRDAVSGRTTINNTPYAGKSTHGVWDPLREALGVSLGDVAVVGEQNILVEGIADQLLLANASVQLESRGQTHLNLTNVAIILFGNNLGVLRTILATGKRLGSKSCILADSDPSGAKLIREGLNHGVHCLQMATYAGPASGNTSIEDLVGIAEYIDAVNEFYSTFDWFSPLDAREEAALRGNLSLGAHLETRFAARFGQDFSKVSVALLLIAKPDLGDTALARFEALIRDILRATAQAPLSPS